MKVTSQCRIKRYSHHPLFLSAAAVRQGLITSHILYVFTKTGRVRITWHWGAFLQLLLQCGINNVTHCECVCVCVCSLRYAACNARAPRCQLLHVQLYNISSRYLINWQLFEKMWLNIKCVLIFYTTFVWNISHSKKNWTRYDHKCTSDGLHVKYRLFLSDIDET